MTISAATERDAIAHRIKALFAKTVENGCTEQEALAAAETARRLMDKHDITMTEAQIRDEPCGFARTDRYSKVQLQPVDYCLKGIERHCAVKSYIQGSEAVFFGLKSGAEMATYLYQFLTRTLDNGWREWFNDPANEIPKGAAHRAKNRQMISSFQLGMAGRINARLIEMADALDGETVTSDGMSLVVVKGAIVEDAWSKLGITLKTRAGISAKSARAYYAGSAAGERVNLNRPIEQDRPSLRIVGGKG